MTMRLALARADVVAPNGAELKRMVVLSRKGQLVITNTSGERLVETAASAVRRDATGAWEVDTPEGVYKVKRDRRCGCAG